MHKPDTILEEKAKPGTMLRSRPRAVLLSEQDVVRGVRVERRVQVDEINGCVLDVASEHVEVVAVVEAVHVTGFYLSRGAP